MCIARFTIKYQSRDEVGPQTPKLIGKDKETLMGKYKLLINRDFDFLDKNSLDNYYCSHALPCIVSTFGFFLAYFTAATIP